MATNPRSVIVITPTGQRQQVISQPGAVCPGQFRAQRADHSPGNLADQSGYRQSHPGRHPAIDIYPAHLHIDILPIGKGQGLGRR